MTRKRYRSSDCPTQAKALKRIKAADPPVDTHKQRVKSNLPTTTTTNDAKPFPFLSLPPELRMDIYELSLPDSTTVNISSTPAKGNMNNALLLTCRQIYNETNHLIYRRRAFVLTETFETKDKKSVPLHFVEHNVGDANVDFTTNLTIDWAKNLDDFLAKHGTTDDIIANANDTTSTVWDLHPETYGDRAEELRCRFPRYRDLESNIGETIKRVQGFSQLTSLTLIMPGARGFETEMDNTYSSYFDECNHILLHHLQWLRHVKKLKIGNTISFECVVELAEKMGVEELDIVWGKEDFYMWLDIVEGLDDYPTVEDREKDGWKFYAHSGIITGGAKKILKKGRKKLLGSAAGRGASQSGRK